MLQIESNSVLIADELDCVSRPVCLRDDENLFEWVPESEVKSIKSTEVLPPTSHRTDINFLTCVPC